MESISSSQVILLCETEVNQDGDISMREKNVGRPTKHIHVSFISSEGL